MNVEGGLIGSVGSVASAVGSSIVNEGPVAPGFLENTMPLTLNRFNLVGEIIFNPEPKTPHQTISVAVADLPSGAEAVDIVEKWLKISKPRTIGVNNIEPLVYAAKPVDLLWKQPAVLPFSYVGEPKIQPKVDQIEFSKIAPQSAILTEVNKKSVQQNLVGQNLEEKVLEEEKVSEKPEISEREEIEELKLKDLLDEETAQQRVYEIGKAIDLAETEAKGEGVDEIEGWRIIKFLRIHIGLISRIARKIRKDGSLDETVEDLVARKFTSEKEAKEQSKEIVAQKEPVKRGKEGKAVIEGAVERVFKYHRVKRSPNEEVVRRVIKKSVIQTGNKAEPVQVLLVEPLGVKETRIEDYLALAEALRPVA